MTETSQNISTTVTNNTPLGTSLKNQLGGSSSSYLRAHKDNPVAWQEWSPQTLELARQHQKLIFLSVGYNACHWCHVMEKESFCSNEVASILNNSFIPIKLDRETRPDLDDIYMNYVTATTGSGGWPLNVFLTPSLQPVFGGTYWPGPSASTRAPVDVDDKSLTFLDILAKMDDIWTTERDRCLQSAADITRQLQAFSAEGTYAHTTINIKGAEDAEPLEPLDLDLLDDALDHFIARYDSQYGGFGSASSASKFPTPANLTFLLRIGASLSRPSTHTRFGFSAPIPAIIGKQSCTKAASMALHTLLAMSRSALRDHLGHGFHRYSVTPNWNLPHFEKMVYDNAQLLSAYCDAWALGRDPEILGTIYDLVEYFTDPTSPIVHPDGGWYSSEDADSTPSSHTTADATGLQEKREGAYYVWTLKEFHSILGDENAPILARHFGVQEDGNIPAKHDLYDDFLSQNVLHIDATPSVLAQEFGLKETEIVRIIKESRQHLRVYRESKRGKPVVDDKIVVSWNGLIISALARAANTLAAFDEDRARRCKDTAIRAADFILSNLYHPESGKLTRIFSSVTNSADRTDKDLAFLDDYAYLIQALIKLYDITMSQTYLEQALKLQDTLDRDFYSSFNGGYFQATRSENQREDGIVSPTVLSPPLPATDADADQEPTKQTESGSWTKAQSRSIETDRILNLKPGTDNALPSANGIVAQNLLYLASYASSMTTVAPDAGVSAQTLESSSSPPSTIALSTSKSSRLQHQARKTIDTFAPEIIQHPFLYVTLLGGVVLDAIGVKCLIVPHSMGDAEIESRALRGFGRTVVRLPSSSSGGIRNAEVMICSKEGVCRPLKEGDLDDDNDDDDDDVAAGETTVQKSEVKEGGFPATSVEGGDRAVEIQAKEERERQARVEDEERRGRTSSGVGDEDGGNPLSSSGLPST